VGAAATVAVVAFILTRGTTSAPQTDDGLRMGDDAQPGAAAPAAPATSAGGKATKADRQPPASTKAQPKVTRTTPVANTGPTSPSFKPGQWIAVLDKYQTDVGVEADTLAKAAAVKLINAGVPARAMLVNGQYPGIADSSLQPLINTWVVYVGPGKSSDQILNLCLAPKTQQAYSSPCPTYQPAVAPG